MKFEAVQVHFLSDVSGLFSSKNFATMAMWLNEFSSLLRTVVVASAPFQSVPFIIITYGQL